MELLQSTLTALQLLWAGDADLWIAIYISVKVCLVALLLASPPAILLGFALAHSPAVAC